MLALLHEVSVLDHVLGQKNLLEGLLVHEVVAVLLGVEELVGAALHVDGLDLRTGGEGVVQNSAVLKIAELGLHEGGTLSRLHVLEPYYLTGLVVELEIKTIFEICCCCHKYLFLNHFIEIAQN